ncbi:MAG: DUF6359 domain-containing protein [Alistipes sp.]|nr:DUF6359 domain-containing protein [Alistipes sp.]
MNRVFRSMWTLLLGVVVLSSCAKQPKEDAGEIWQMAFDEWMTLYGDGAEKQASGIYIKKLKTVSGVVNPPRDGDWVRINYTGRVMTNGNIFVTRDSLTAQLQGTFEYYTHYVPQFVAFDRGEESKMLDGVYEALSMMNQGEVARVYIPYTLAFGSDVAYFDSGYEGQIATVVANTPIIMDLELVEVVREPLTREIETVQQYAYEKWGKTVDDTIAPNVYRRSLRLGKETGTVKSDTLVSVYYVGRFLDGFVFDTNIEDTARKYNIYSSSKNYDSITVNTSGSDTTYVKGFYKGIVGMKFGETAQTLFPSTYGYGTETQDKSGTTWIQPYSPLIFTIMVVPPNGDGTTYHPYSVKGFQAQTQMEQDIWVRGYVVGAVEGSSVESGAVYGDTVKVKTNILIADTRTAAEASKVIAVELPEGVLRDKLNLVDNALTIYRKKIAFRGNMASYLGQTGVVDLQQYVK